MSSDAIKTALTTKYPDTIESEWKRRTKSKVDTLIKREFEHPSYGRVATYETPTGDITVGEEPVIIPVVINTVKSSAPKEPVKIQVKPSATKKKTVPIKNSSNIKEGDQIEIPAGIHVMGMYANDYFVREHNISKKPSKVTVSKVETNPVAWASYLPQTDIDYINKMVKPDWRWGDFETRAHENIDNTPLMQQAIAYAKERYTELYGEKPVFVFWAKNRKAAFINDVRLLDNQEQTAPKEQKITKRKLMVQGSVWTITNDIDLVMWVRNPELDRLIRQRDNLRVSPHRTHSVGGQIIVTLGGGRGNTPSEKAQIDAIQKKINETPDKIKTNIGKIVAGTQIEIVGKLSPSSYIWGDKKQTNGLTVPVKVLEGNVEIESGYENELKHYIGYGQGYVLGLPFPLIEPYAEPVSIPETLVYLLRDTATGNYYAGPNTKHDGPSMVPTISGAKKYTSVSAAKASIRDFTGYNAGLDNENDNGNWYNEYSGEKKFDLPSTWEMVAIDKTTNATKDTIDVQNWYTNLMRLRTLTVLNGSAFRETYKKAEKKGFDAILSIRNMEEYRDDRRVLPFSEGYDEEIKLKMINDALETLAEKHIVTKNASAFAIACDKTDAFLAKMCINHSDLDVTVYDMKTLDAITDNG